MAEHGITLDAENEMNAMGNFGEGLALVEAAGGHLGHGGGGGAVPDLVYTKQVKVIMGEPRGER